MRPESRGKHHIARPFNPKFEQSSTSFQDVIRLLKSEAPSGSEKAPREAQMSNLRLEDGILKADTDENGVKYLETLSPIKVSWLPDGAFVNRIVAEETATREICFSPKDGQKQDEAKATTPSTQEARNEDDRTHAQKSNSPILTSTSNSDGIGFHSSGAQQQEDTISDVQAIEADRG
ncbi:hypothetical protein CYMTET_17540 [Cymbomonas tetramitiformis]|uniref:Uncharacterized protein n=1 Tax=Cymbomonas tetramitiformis TaxID=36881 RepID=A0AAE0G9Z0_9CHLO|nr:hypothetical protein CYMTET_17540 [Cymbomonas tetramitiformis]